MSVSDTDTTRFAMLLAKAMTLDSDARTELLDEIAEESVELRYRIENRLSAPATDDQRLAAPVDEPGDSAEVADVSELDEEVEVLEPLPERIGRYKVLGILGHGGMGTVYLAEQGRPIRRRVALKVLPPVHNRRLRQRFAGECQAMARLSHPNIAQLYEVGETAFGQPFLAIELVEGDDIGVWCDSKQLPIEDRLELFLDVCAGVRHAHEKGVLHQDLKPNNIMVSIVDGRPVAKVIDFGISSALDEPLVEGHGPTRMGIAGTPAYMSPEAFKLEGARDLDTRSDVYSLGVVLYELLVGALPTDKGHLSLPAFIRIIDEVDLTPATQRLTQLTPEKRRLIAERRKLSVDELPRRLRGDLEAVLIKATARERERRYGSPAELADDLRRHLRAEPVGARRPSKPYLINRFVRRNRGTVVAGIIVLLVLIAGIVGTSVGLVQARRATERATAEAEAARQAKAEADGVAAFLIGLFQEIDPLDARGIDAPRGEGVTARQLLDRGVEKITVELQDEKSVRARLLHTLGQVYSSLGIFEKAQPLIEEAIELDLELFGPDHIDSIKAQRDLGRMYESMADYEKAEDNYRLALAHALPTLGESHAVTIEAMEFVGKILLTRGRPAEAREQLDRALILAREHLGEDHWVVADTVNALAWMHYSLGELDQAEVHFRSAAEIARSSYGRSDVREDAATENTSLAINLNNLAWVLVLQGELDDGEAAIEESLLIFRRVLPADNWRIANAESILGALRARQGRYRQAEILLLGSLPTVLGSTGENSVYSRVLRERLVDLYTRWDRPEEADRFSPRQE